MKHKKLLVTALLSLSLGLVACGNSESKSNAGGSQTQPSNHKHTWTDWEVTEEATCEKEGSKERTCKDCSEKETQKINKKSHEYVDWEGDATHVPVQATCAADGKKFKKCKGCGDIKEEVIAKGAHNFGTETTQTDPVGSKVKVCPTCSKTQISWAASATANAVSGFSKQSDDSMKFSGKSLNAGGKAAEADYVEYKVNSPKQMTGAQMIFDALGHSQGVEIFKTQANDDKPGYILKGDEYVKTDYRIGVIVNGQDATYIPAADFTDVESSERGEYVSPFSINLLAGENTIKFVNQGGYRLQYYNFIILG